VSLSSRVAASLGCRESVVDIPSGRTGRIALSSECSYRIVVCMSRVTASCSSRSGGGARCARGRRVSTHSSSKRMLKGMRQIPLQTRLGVRPRLHGRLEFETRRVRTSLCRPYPGRRGRAQRAKLPSGSYVGLGIRRSKFRPCQTRQKWLCERSLPPPPGGDGLRGLWARCRSEPCRTFAKSRKPPE
jgi:hypothetical protein